MRTLRDISIKRKLMAIIMLTSGVVLLIASAAFVMSELITFRRVMIEELSTLAEVIGTNSRAALAFNDQESAEETLAGLQADPHIISACIYTQDGKVFAKYLGNSLQSKRDEDHFGDGLWEPPEVMEEGHRFWSDHVDLFKRIVLDGDVIGTVYIQSDLQGLYSRLRWYVRICAIVMLASSSVAFLLSSKLQRLISEPILRLARTMKAVSEEKNYSIRVEGGTRGWEDRETRGQRDRGIKGRNDELGILIDGFNEMLAQIDVRDQKLEQHRDQLEDQGVERTAELSKINQDLEQAVVELVRSNEQLKREIAERKRAEEALRRAHARNELLLTSISSILISVNSDDCVTHWNAAAETAFAIAAAHVTGQPFLECGIQWDWSEIAKRISDCRKENRPTRLSDILYTRSDGKDGLLNITLNPFAEEDPIQCGFLLLGEEITELKVMEDHLRQAQKLESIGELAAGIAHEINTPIQYVGDNTRFLQESFTDISGLLEKYQHFLDATKAGAVTAELVTEVENAVDEADIEFLSQEIPIAIQQSLEGINRVAEIVRAMKEFSHPGVEEKATIDINGAIQSTITIARNEWKYVAEVETDFDVDLPLVPCLQGEFKQVILNVLTNAAHAITDVVGDGSQGKGVITVSTRRDGDWAEVGISDTGTGIPEEIRSRIFDLFFTTKDVGKGTGQGLTISYNVIVEKHGGTITFNTEVGKGTTFIIRLPIDAVPEGERERAQQSQKGDNW